MTAAQATPAAATSQPAFMSARPFVEI